MEIEKNKIKGEAKSLKLENGVVLTYGERGEENKEIIITGAFYHHTFMPVVEELAKRYHVYAVVMRLSGPGDQLNEDGSIHWGKQWGKDIYDFSCKLGIEKFHYVGKCHGTIPGWWLVKNHPEVLLDFCSFFLGPHTKPANSDHWCELLKSGDSKPMIQASIRNIESGLKKKQEEMESIGNVSNPAILTYGGFAEKLWDNDIQAIEQTLRNTNVKIGYLFGSEDPLFLDHYDSNMYLPFITKGCHFTILQGEKHLMELDCPDRVANEAFFFIEQAHKNYQ